MPPTQLPLTLQQLHTNQQLFSDHYLNVTLPQRPDWQLLAHDAAAALATLAPIVRAFLRAPAQNEAQTEDDLIKPVLRALGHTFEVQAALRTPDGTKKPDYIFYRDAAALAANKAVKVLGAELRPQPDRALPAAVHPLRRGRVALAQRAAAHAGWATLSARAGRDRAGRGEHEVSLRRGVAPDRSPARREWNRAGLAEGANRCPSSPPSASHYR